MPLLGAERLKVGTGTGYNIKYSVPTCIKVTTLLCTCLYFLCSKYLHTYVYFDPSFINMFLPGLDLAPVTNSFEQEDHFWPQFCWEHNKFKILKVEIKIIKSRKPI